MLTVKSLISDLSTTDFADLQAQTAAYGLFAARCSHNAGSGPFTRQSAIFAENDPVSSGCLWPHRRPRYRPAYRRGLWTTWPCYLTGRTWARSLPTLAAESQDEDPVVHFYEDFLAAYDPRMRRVAGCLLHARNRLCPTSCAAWTSCCVNRFDLADGLADTEKIKVEVS